MADSDKYIEYLKDLPVVPEVATKILKLAEDNLDISFKELESIIRMDPGLTAKILRIANSALYARQKEITNLQMAITLLGFKNIKSLVLLVTASNMFSNMRKTSFHDYFWRHSLITGFIARSISQRCGKASKAEEVFLSGLLHDIGQAAFFSYDKEGYLKILERRRNGEASLEALENEYFGLDHRDVGGAILEKWNFPDMYVDTAREHNSLNIKSPHKSVIITVTVADLMAEKLGFGDFTEDEMELFDKILPYSCLKDSDVEYYLTRFIDEIKEDPFFKDSKTLFGLK